MNKLCLGLYLLIGTATHTMEMEPKPTELADDKPPTLYCDESLDEYLDEQLLKLQSQNMNALPHILAISIKNDSK